MAVAFIPCTLSQALSAFSFFPWTLTPKTCWGKCCVHWKATGERARAWQVLRTEPQRQQVVCVDDGTAQWLRVGGLGVTAEWRSVLWAGQWDLLCVGQAGVGDRWLFGDRFGRTARGGEGRVLTVPAGCRLIVTGHGRDCGHEGSSPRTRLVYCTRGVLM